MKANTFKKILVATDHTDFSENAVNTGAVICQQQNAKLILLHIVEDVSLYTPSEVDHVNLEYGIQLKNAATIHLTKLSQKIREKYGIQVKEIVAFGGVVKEILHTIHEKNPDLVLIGTHGTSGFRNFFIGSTAYRVIKHTKFPIMTIPGEGDWTKFRNILFPIRHVPNALKKYDVIRPIIRSNNSMVHVLGLALDSEADKMQDVVKLVHKLEDRLKEDEVNYEIAYDQCHNYADAILTVAGKKKADLIVITATLDHTIREFFINPFSQQVINHAKIPVLCIRPK
jgi:nucleotide-binding universal stress UspA family protein